MHWLQAFKSKPYSLHIIVESEIENYKAAGFEVRRLDPSVTGNWIFADKKQSQQFLDSVKRTSPEWYMDVAGNLLEQIRKESDALDA